jgi:hypothetical protein
MRPIDDYAHGDHADGEGECRGKYGSMDVVGSDSNITPLNGFKCVTWCSTSRDSLTRSIPGDWSCPCQ